MEEKAKAKEFLLKLMETALKRAPHNVPQPMPLIEEKAQNRLSSDDLISWKLMLREWQKVSVEGKKEISKLLMLNSYNILETINIVRNLADETKGTVEFVAAHPEWGKSHEEIDSASFFEDFTKELGLE